MKNIGSYLCGFVDCNDHITLSSVFTPEHLTKNEMILVLDEYKNYKKELLDSYYNNTYNQKDVDNILNSKDKITLIANAIKNYDQEKKGILDGKFIK